MIFVAVTRVRRHPSGDHPPRLSKTEHTNGFHYEGVSVCLQKPVVSNGHISLFLRCNATLGLEENQRAMVTKLSVVVLSCIIFEKMQKIHLSPCSFLNCSSLQMINFHDFFAFCSFFDNFSHLFRNLTR